MNIVFPNMPVTSWQLSNSLVDETGTGNIVLNTSPTLVTPVLTGTVSGSTAAGGTLTLTGTSSATKSVTGISLGSVVTVDEINGRVGVGTTAPVEKLDVVGTVASAGVNIKVKNSTDTGGNNVQYAGLNFVVGSDNGTSAIRSYRTNLGVNYTTALTFLTNPIGATQTPVEQMRIDSAGNVGIGTTLPTSLLALGGTAARIIKMERNTTAATAGQGLTVSSGGAIAGTADLAGGDLALRSGISTGVGSSVIRFLTPTPGTTGTADNTLAERANITSTGLAVIGAISATTTIKTSGYTVATLPAGVTGARAYVTDATSPTYNGSLTGGGTVVVPVFYNGSAWVSA